jgi:hypothetical protein
LGRIGELAFRSPKAALAHLLPAVDDDRALWVFGGSSGRSYSDNASVVHRYVNSARPDVTGLWVIDADSPDVPSVAGTERPLDRNSLHAHRVARSADVILFSHGVHDVPGMLWSNEAIRVRLGHGLTAFGRTRGRMPRSTQRMTRAVDLAPVASTMEQDHKVQWGFPREKLPITGLPRWDEMLTKRRARGTVVRPHVLYAPTSRPWHSSSDAQPDGALRPIFDFLTSARLRRALEAGDFALSVYFHQITRYRFGTFDWVPPGVTLVTEEASLPGIIASTDLVISDYSSILWDALYIDVPTIFYQFDRAEHERNRGSYIDLGQRLFGPIAQTPREMLDALAEASVDGFRLERWSTDRDAWQERAFAFRDANNAARVTEAIDALRQ